MKKDTRSRAFLGLALVCVLVFALASLASAESKAKPIILGCPVSMGVAYGPDTRDALSLAIKEINAAGGVNVGGQKRPFTLVIEDTRAMEPGVPVTDALLGLERLITARNADFLVGGPVRSEASFAGRNLMNKYKKISIITTGTYSPKYGDAKKYPYCFRITGSVVFEITKMHMGLLKHLKDKFGFTKIYVINQDVQHARKAGELVAKLASKKGFEILGRETYPTGATDFSVALLNAKNKGAQIMFLWMDMPELAILAKQFTDLKVPALPVGYMGPAEHLSWWTTTDGKGEFFVVDLLNAGNAPSKATPLTMKFVDAFKKEYGREPDAYGISTSYTAPFMLKAAIEKAGTLDSDAVAKALEKTDMESVYGRVRFDKNHEVIPSLDPKEGVVGTIVQWQKGKRVTVFPESIAVGQIMLPPWMKKK